MSTSGIEIDEGRVLVQVNDEWCDAKIIAEQDDLLFVSVDTPDGESLQTWQSDGDSYVVIGNGIADIDI